MKTNQPHPVLPNQLPLFEDKLIRRIQRPDANVVITARLEPKNQGSSWPFAFSGPNGYTFKRQKTWPKLKSMRVSSRRKVLVWIGPYQTSPTIDRVKRFIENQIPGAVLVCRMEDAMVVKQLAHYLQTDMVIINSMSEVMPDYDRLDRFLSKRLLQEVFALVAIDNGMDVGLWQLMRIRNRKFKQVKLKIFPAAGCEVERDLKEV